MYADKLRTGFALMGIEDEVFMPPYQSTPLADFTESGLSSFDDMSDRAEPLGALAFIDAGARTTH